MNFQDFPKHFRITQAVLLALLYLFLCVLAVGGQFPIQVAVGLYCTVSVVVAMIHYIRDEKFVSISNLCFAAIVVMVTMIFF